MKSLLKTALVVSLVALMFGPADARRGRKLPYKAYLSSAKIEVLGYADSKEPARIETAIAMLDSLFMHYGPVSEGYFWYSQIQWDLAAEKSDLDAKKPLVEKAIVYADSVKWSCGNKDIEDKYRDDCKDFDEQLDSIRVLQWREYYNAGVAQITEIEELSETVKVVSDSAELAYYQNRLDAIIDSCQDNMSLAIIVDSTDARPFIGIATVKERTGAYEEAIEYLERALPKSEEKGQILTSIAYDYIQSNDYCASIPYFKQYVDMMTDREEVMQAPDNRAAVLGTAHNLAICYNNCEFYDSAFYVYQEVLSFDSTDVEALKGVGRYYRQLGREAADSARAAQEANNADLKAEMTKQRDALFDSSRVYLGKAFELDPDDAALAAEYALMAAILQNFEEAKVGFARATELKPENVDYWISLGDCHLSLKDWPAAAEAYEKVVELKPENNKVVWERLADLYLEIGNNQRRAEILEKLETM